MTHKVRFLKRSLAATAAIVAIFLIPRGWAQQPSPTPKYGQGALRLFDAREFVREKEAADYWAIAPYYVGQPDEGSCSAACVAMAVNALRAERTLNAEEKLATPEAVVKVVEPRLWKEKLGPQGDGVTLDELAEIVMQVLTDYRLAPANVQVLRFDEEGEAKARLRELLIDNEQSGRDIVLVNFLQSELTGDPEGAVGHFAPVGAYDAERGRVLLFDPDREWYEPYWVSEAALLHAMATRDPVSSKPRGLIRITVGGK